MRYSAATCDPADFLDNRFTLRQKLYQQPRTVELFIVVTMYNEDDALLARTLIGVFQNVNYMESLKESTMWGANAWKKIVVCIVSDGIAKINPRSAALLAGLGVFQQGIAKAKINKLDTEAHIFEYTTQMEPVMRGETVSVQKGNTPVQLLFCLKQKNAQKINSHRWFFQAFGRCLEPNICVLLDAGTKPGKHSIFKLWNVFDRNKHCAGACGEIKADLGKGGRNLLNPLVATQNFEYKMSNILDKPLESAFGFISVLPGAFSAYRYEALQGEPMIKYFAGEKMHNNSNFFTANMYLAEDRILCYELVAKKDSKWVLQYVKNSTGETDVPTEVPDFISQRRRWLNGSLFAAVYTVVHFWKIWQSGHGFIRKCMLQVEVVYQVISMVFAWFALGNFYLVFKILVGSLGDPSLLGKAGLVLSVFFEWSYVICLIACFILALGNTPKGTKKVYVGMTIYWAIVMTYLMFATVYLSVKSVQAEIKDGFKFSDLLTNKTFATLILSMLSTYVLCQLSQKWGTKGANDAPAGGSVDSGKDGKAGVELPSDPDAQYKKELEVLAEVRKEEESKTSDEDVKKFYYASVRSWIVMAWIFSNLSLITLVMKAGSVGIITKTKTSEEEAQRKNSDLYLYSILWSVAGLSAFRFVGSVWFLVHRKFAGI
ncbi:hypothetical protein EG328_010663 [Venturia inaequalis]|uniref:Chitin synthase n=1 Tax=Venturia inaequalis TaxID=5025 RepID=A0A8H3VLR3_VENIN|nr:hypothetical protein EG328_010663 [Venturia inaequalis]KAE9991160.1 hypothetical protein EG327_000342 [Venturia inaequalis]